MKQDPDTKKVLLQYLSEQRAFFSSAPDPKGGHFHPLMWREHNLWYQSSEDNTSAVQQSEVMFQPVLDTLNMSNNRWL